MIKSEYEQHIDTNIKIRNHGDNLRSEKLWDQRRKCWIDKHMEVQLPDGGWSVEEASPNCSYITRGDAFVGSKVGDRYVFFRYLRIWQWTTLCHIQVFTYKDDCPTKKRNRPVIKYPPVSIIIQYIWCMSCIIRSLLHARRMI